MRYDITDEFKKFIKGLVKTLNRQNISIGKTAGLQDNSNLIKSFTTKSNYKKIQFLAFEYLKFVDRGRRPFAKKVPVEMLIDWIKRYNISYPGYTTNKLAYAIQTNIYKYGIEKRDFIKTIENSMVDTTEQELTKLLEDRIADSFAAAFDKKGIL